MELDEREYRLTDESYYHTFFTLFQKYSAVNANIAKILPIYNYISPVSHPYNYKTKAHKKNNATTLLSSIPPPQDALYFASIHSNATGRTVTYSYNYSEYSTSGDYFQYDHSGYLDPCLLHSISLKLVDACGDFVLTRTPNNRKLIRTLLITAVQRSG